MGKKEWKIHSQNGFSHNQQLFDRANKNLTNATVRISPSVWILNYFQLLCDRLGRYTVHIVEQNLEDGRSMCLTYTRM